MRGKYMRANIYAHLPVEIVLIYVSKIVAIIICHVVYQYLNITKVGDAIGQGLFQRVDISNIALKTLQKEPKPQKE